MVQVNPACSAAPLAWRRAREERFTHLVETEPAELRTILEAAKNDGVDLVVVDARPGAEADVAHVAHWPILVPTPTRPAIFDLRAILGTLDRHGEGCGPSLTART